MSGQVRRLLEQRLSSILDPTVIALLFSFPVALILLHVSATVVFCGQTRAECRKCCDKKGLDDYFTEQCKLKCFRNPEHCTGSKGTVRQAPVKRHAATKRRSRRRAFRWPNPLNLTPGKEWEAAAQILSMNGITPRHRNAAPALQALETILKEFVRTHPQGGSLPTDRIRRIIRKYR